MNFPDSVVFVMGVKRECPYYQKKDEFSLSGRGLHAPAGKPACMTLAHDIATKIEDLIQPEDSETDEKLVYVFDCSGPETGCAGLLRLGYRERPEKELIIEKIEAQIEEQVNEQIPEQIEQEQPKNDEYVGEFADTVDMEYDDTERMVKLLTSFSIFRNLERHQVLELLPHLKMKKYPKGKIIVRQGEPGVNMYVILSGKVEVLDENEIRIAILEKGEIFGEMSLLSGDLVTATIRVMEPVWVIFVKGQDFNKLLADYPDLQMYFARMLAKRLAKSNITMSKEASSGMTGKLSEMPTVEICQILYQNHKTGVLRLDLPRGAASIAFKSGTMVGASYIDLIGKDAFFTILKETAGRFQFHPELPAEFQNKSSLGDFMWLIMTGLTMIDEEGTVED